MRRRGNCLQMKTRFERDERTTRKRESGGPKRGPSRTERPRMQDNAAVTAGMAGIRE